MIADVPTEIWNRNIIFFYFLQIYNLLYNRPISKYIIRKHLCGAIIQWWFSYVYCTLCCACVYSSSPLSSFTSDGHCRFSLRLTFNGLFNNCFRVLLVGYSIRLSISLFLLWWMEFEDHYVTWSLKHTMGHWLWCAVLLIEVFGLFWCLMV
jgi:hypothetical protein